MIENPQIQLMFVGYYYHHQEVIDKIEFDDNKTEQAIDINRALAKLRSEKKKAEVSTKAEPIPEDPLNKDESFHGVNDQLELE